MDYILLDKYRDMNIALDYSKTREHLFHFQSV